MTSGWKKKLNTDDATLFKFAAEGDSIEGYLVQSADVETTFGVQKRYVFLTEQGLKSVFGSHMLNAGLAEIAPGTNTRVTFIGTKAIKGRNPMKLFDVEYNDSDVIDIGSIATQQTAPAPAALAEDVIEEQPVQEKLPPPSRVAAKPAAAPTAEARQSVAALLKSRAKPA